MLIGWSWRGGGRGHPERYVTYGAAVVAATSGTSTRKALTLSLSSSVLTRRNTFFRCPGAVSVVVFVGGAPEWSVYLGEGVDAGEEDEGREDGEDDAAAATAELYV